jgi:hypothetical protein
LRLDRRRPPQPQGVLPVGPGQLGRTQGASYGEAAARGPQRRETRVAGRAEPGP